jgi:hypothetical protein
MSTPAFTDGEHPPVLLDGATLTAEGVAATSSTG